MFPLITTQNFDKWSVNGVHWFQSCQTFSHSLQHFYQSRPNSHSLTNWNPPKKRFYLHHAYLKLTSLNVIRKNWHGTSQIFFFKDISSTNKFLPGFNTVHISVQQSNLKNTYTQQKTFEDFPQKTLCNPFWVYRYQLVHFLQVYFYLKTILIGVY